MPSANQFFIFPLPLLQSKLYIISLKHKAVVNTSVLAVIDSFVGRSSFYYYSDCWKEACLMAGGGGGGGGSEGLGMQHHTKKTLPAHENWHKLISTLNIILLNKWS